MVLTGEAGWPVSSRELLTSQKAHHWDYVIVCVATLSVADPNLCPHAFVVSTLLTQATSKFPGSCISSNSLSYLLS